MAGWERHNGLAVALARENVDTDQLIPARFMSAPRAEGYGGFLLYDLRRDAAGELLSDMALNRHPGASILIAGRNFGSGSSREAAVYALIDAGIRAVAAPSFGDIFLGNAVNNGLLPAQISAEASEALFERLADSAQQASIDIRSGRLILGTAEVGFDLDAAARMKLINGWDDIDLTLKDTASIGEFRDRRQTAAPWAWPADED